MNWQRASGDEPMTSEGRAPCPALPADYNTTKSLSFSANNCRWGEKAERKKRRLQPTLDDWRVRHPPLTQSFLYHFAAKKGTAAAARAPVCGSKDSDSIYPVTPNELPPPRRPLHQRQTIGTQCILFFAWSIIATLRLLLDLTDDLAPSAASTPSNFFAENKLRGAFVVEERREE